MTSKLTREQLHERARENVKALKMASRQTAFESAREEILADLQLAELALAAMDSEPVIVVGDDGGDALAYRRLIQSFAPGTKLYRHAQPAPVVMDGYVMVPKEMTDEIGEAIAMQANCCGGIALDIYDAMLAAAPQSPGSEPATVPGKWIPVSERMPLTPSADCEYSDIEVNVFDGERVFTAHYATGSQPHPCGYWVDTYAKITHWQPLPSAPREDKP